MLSHSLETSKTFFHLFRKNRGETSETSPEAMSCPVHSHIETAAIKWCNPPVPVYQSSRNSDIYIDCFRVKAFLIINWLLKSLECFDYDLLSSAMHGFASIDLTGLVLWALWNSRLAYNMFSETCFCFGPTGSRPMKWLWHLKCPYHLWMTPSITSWWRNPPTCQGNRPAFPQIGAMSHLQRRGPLC